MSRIFCVCILVAGMFTNLTLSAKNELVKTKLNPKTGEVVLLPLDAFEEGDWRINNYKKKQEVTFSYPEEKTPTGAPIIKIDFKTPGGGCNVIAPRLKNGGSWRSSNFGAVSFWIKGDNAGKKVKFAAGTIKNSYSWSVILNSDKWRKVTLPINSAFSRQGDKKDLNLISILYFASNESASFSAGDFRLEPSAMEIPARVLPTIVIPRIKGNNPVIDGSLSEDVWKKAFKIDNLINIKTKQPATEKSEIYLISTGEKLYIGAKMQDQDTLKMRASQKQRDLQVWQDDAFEILVDDKLDAKSYRHIILNSLGTSQDYHFCFNQVKETYLYEKGWNPEFTAKEKITPTLWIEEISVPLKELGITPGVPFGLQLGRENHQIREYSALANSDRFTIRIDYAVAVIGSPKAEFSKPVLKMKGKGEMTLTGSLNSVGPYELNLAIADPYGKVQRETIKDETDKSGQLSTGFNLKVLAEGNYRITMWGKAGTEEMKPVAVSFAMSLPPEIEFGDIYLNPRPKELKWEKGVFEFDAKTPIIIPENASDRTRKTARFLRTEVQLNLFEMLPPIKNRVIEGKTFRLMLKKDAKGFDDKVMEKVKALPKQGYYLDVTPEGVTIVGADKAGLYYGVVTLRQLIRGHLVKKHEPVVDCVRIFDWPDIDIRFVSVWLRAFRRPKESKFDINLFKKYVKEVIAGNKFNHLSIFMDRDFEYDEETGISRAKSAMSKEEYLSIVRVSEDNFVNFIPALQSGGHSAHFTNAYPKLQEPGYDHDQVNVLDPDWHDILFRCYDDILQLTPKAKYFFIWHDEWWHHPRAEVKDSFMGKKRWEIFRDEIIAIHGYFKKRGIRIVMCCDMLLKQHNGGYPHHIAKALKALPRDIIMLNWSVRAAPGAAKELTDMGFDVWDVTNQFKILPPQDVPVVKGYGVIQYGHFYQTFWYSRDHVLPDYTHAPFRGGEYGWNMKRDSQLPLGEWRRRYLNSVMSLYNFPNRRVAKWRKSKVVDLKEYANCDTKEWFGNPKMAPVIDRGSLDIAFVPMKLNAQSGNDVVAATAEQEEVKIDLNSSGIQSVFFLQGTYLPKDKKKDFKKRSTQYLYGVPCGEIRIEYEDGPSEIIPLRMGVNTNQIIPLISSRFMYECRYVHDIKAVSGAKASLYLIEWTNPYPFRKIKRIVWKGYDTEATPVLFAMSITY